MISYNYISSKHKKNKRLLPKYPNRPKRPRRSIIPYVLLLAVVFIAFTLFIVFLSPRIAFPSQRPAEAASEHSPWQTREGQLFFKTDIPGEYEKAPTMNTDVKITVTALIAKASVLQHFENDGDTWVEGIYAFPLPEDAAVTHLRMHIGERIIEGQVQEKTRLLY